MIRRPPRSTPFPTRRSSDLKHRFWYRQGQSISRWHEPCGPSCTSGHETLEVAREHGRSGSRSSLTFLDARPRSEEHTSELQSRQYLVCRLLLEKKKKTT